MYVCVLVVVIKKKIVRCDFADVHCIMMNARTYISIITKKGDTYDKDIYQRRPLRIQKSLLPSPREQL